MSTFTAYHEYHVPVKTSINLIEEELLTHIEFDTGNSTNECERKIQIRKENSKKPRKTTKIWSNFYFSCSISIICQVNIGICLIGMYFLKKSPIMRTKRNRDDCQVECELEIQEKNSKIENCMIPDKHRISGVYENARYSFTEINE